MSRALRLALVPAVLGLAVGLAGCDTTDPRRGGFVGGGVGMMNGNYDRRIAVREAELDRLASAEAAMDRRIASASSQSAALTARIARLNRTLGEIRRQQAALEARTGGEAALRAERDELRARFIALSERNADRNRMLAGIRGEASAGGAVAETEVDRDVSEAERLKAEIEARLSRLR